jgi:hypothetical protein
MLITADSTDWTADGACLINGGGAAIPYNITFVPGDHVGVSLSQQVPPWYFPQFYEGSPTGRSPRPNNWWLA